MITIGKVIIAGAGAGEVDLLTVKALKAIQTADCILYDRLVNEDMLKFAKPDAELLYMGKKSCGCSDLQATINQTMVDKAQDGKSVLRLKGGDPFVFGRGYEEVEFLIAHNISYELIPGVSSLLAVPMAAGIPLTHRERASSFHTFTGHGAHSELDYATIAKLEGTLVFFMSIGNLDTICTNLVAAGKSSNTPVAIIENGTLLNQRVIGGTLENIVRLRDGAQIKPPALLIIGDVASYANLTAELVS